MPNVSCRFPPSGLYPANPALLAAWTPDLLFGITEPTSSSARRLDPVRPDSLRAFAVDGGVKELRYNNGQNRPE
jgi:hypothetical protein